MAEKLESKEKDINQIIRYLSTTFNKATAKLDRPTRTNEGGANKSYIIQTEFAYLLNEIMQCPRCVMQKHIVDCNEFLDQLVQDIAKSDTASTVS